jgi:hypothetical protein
MLNRKGAPPDTKNPADCSAGLLTVVHTVTSYTRVAATPADPSNQTLGIHSSDSSAGMTGLMVACTCAATLSRLTTRAPLAKPWRMFADDPEGDATLILGAGAIQDLCGHAQLALDLVALVVAHVPGDRHHAGLANREGV